MRNKFLFFGFIGGLVLLVAFWAYVPRQRLQQQLSVTHASFFSQPEFYDQAYSSARPLERVPGARGVLLNHHLLAAPFIAEALSTIATDKPVTVLLISPNHFSAGQGTVITSEATWQTPYGLLQSDVESVRALTRGGIAEVEEAPFEREHGVTGIVAFIKRSLPNAKVIPLMVNDRLAVPEAQALARRMYALLPPNILVVGSFDFSHYLPSRAAQFHDELSLSAVGRFDYAALPRLDIDSRPGLTLFLQMMEGGKTSHFTLLEHKNSAELTHLPDTLETTSYITGYFTKGDSEEISIAQTGVYTALLVGRIDQFTDLLVSLDRHSKVYALEYVQRLLTGQQFTVASVDTTLSPVKSVVRRLGFNHIIGQQGELELGQVKIAYMRDGSVARAQELVDQGNTVVCIASGVPSITQYGGGVIVHLGPFLTTDMLTTAEQSTLAVGAVAKGKQLALYLLPIGYTQGKAKLLVGQADDTLLTKLAAQSAVSDGLKEQIKTGILTISLK